MPGDANIGPHLHVDFSDAGVQASAHENVIEEVSGHADGFSGNDRGKVREEWQRPTPKHGDGHEVAEVVDDAG